MLSDSENQQDGTADTESVRPQRDRQLFDAQESPRPRNVCIRDIHGAENIRPSEA